MQHAMPERSTASNQYMDYLRVESAKAVKTSTLSKSVITATHLSKDAPNHGYVDQHVTEDAFLLSVQLKDYHGDLWVDGRNVVFPTSRRGNFTFYDYNRIWQADMKSAFDCLNFHIPRAAITSLEADLGPGRIETLDILPGADMDDATVRGIAEALLPAVNAPENASGIFVDHVCLALSVHLAVTYGGAKALAPVHTGGLAPWQLNRAMEMMDAHLSGDLPVAAIAQACGLSPAYFTRAFKQSTGFPPYRWMTRRRIDKAMALMRNTTFSLGEIAYTCGFSDQAHFTRVFSGITGLAPGQWKRRVLL